MKNILVLTFLIICTIANASNSLSRSLSRSEIYPDFTYPKVSSKSFQDGVFDRDYQLLVVNNIDYYSISKSFAADFGDENRNIIGLQTHYGYLVVPVKDYIEKLFVELPKSDKNKLNSMLDSPYFKVNDLADLLEKTHALKALLKQPYRIFSSSFIHANTLHLGLNLLKLYNLFKLGDLQGAELSSVLILSTIGSSIGSAIAGPHSSSIGSSGAIYGVIGYNQSLQNKSPYHISADFIKNSLITEGVGRIANLKIAHASHFSGLVTGVLFQSLVQSFIPVLKPRISSKWVVGTYASLSIISYIYTWFLKNNFKFNQKFISNPYPGIAHKLRTISHLYENETVQNKI
ncbi:MAG: rhomboid family intramembrane serine protease [Oligoflexales bacterium]